MTGCGEGLIAEFQKWLSLEDPKKEGAKEIVSILQNNNCRPEIVARYVDEYQKIDEAIRDRENSDSWRRGLMLKDSNISLLLNNVFKVRSLYNSPEYIDLSNNQLSAAPAEVWSSGHLFKVDLSQNNIREVLVPIHRT